MRTEPSQLRVESRTKSVPVDAGYRLRVVTDNECRSHVANLPAPARA